MSWNYRIVRRTFETGEAWLEIYEAYYNSNGEICGLTQKAVNPCGYTEEELKESLNRMLEAFNKPILEHENIEFYEWD